ncbi:MAG TPA: M13 family metallopeptidase [Steroidobacteraceae bacterium]|nr:M13 family metallopeptidase [Steroidobacteraceae bacterium]
MTVQIPFTALAAALCGAALATAVADAAMTETAGVTSPSVAADTHERASGLDLAALDRAVAPGDDFFRYANGTWLKDTPIPADRASYGVFEKLIELTTARAAHLMQQAAAAHAPAGSESRKIGDYYASFMDEAGIERRGLRPLEPELARIAAIGSRRDLARFLGGTLRADVDVLNNTHLHTPNLFGLWVARDLDDPARYAAFLIQGGLEMPDRDYYLDASPRMEEERSHYRAHIARMLELAHVPEATAKAARIFALERRIAAVHVSRADSEDVRKGDNHWTRAELAARAPGLDWPAYLESARLSQQGEFIVWQPRAVTGICALVASQPLETWKEYLTFHAIEHAAPFLPKAFVAESFAFFGKQLTGTPQQRERWKRAADATSAALGEAVGQLYVQRYFPASAKAQAQAMVRNLIVAFGRRIDRLEWMTPETRAKAKAKLATLDVEVGYPDRWRDYSGLEVRRDDALGNAERAERFEYERNLAKLGRPVEHGEWVMYPQTVNAVNLPVMNALNFPAAILQPPFFDPNRPQVMNYGAIGAVMGHEISHSFDDQGALFDASGRLRNWWAAADFAHFRAAAQRLVREFDQYHPFPDLAVNGRQTLSENIADLGGLAVAYDAYRLSLHGEPAPAVDGFTGDQQFFLSFAQSWRRKTREPALRQQIITDGHAPSEYRADTVRNLDPWYAAFHVTAGERLYLAPPDRVRIW